MLFITFVTSFISCKNEKKKFPLSEATMIKHKMYGELLEYAIFDNSKIEFVENIICESLTKNKNFVFRKSFFIIENDSSNYFFTCMKKEYFKGDPFNMIYFDINQPDSIYNYSPDLKFSIYDINKMIDKISNRNNKTIEETLKHTRINNYFIPNFHITILFDSMDCNHKFVQKVIKINGWINLIMKSYSQTLFPNENVIFKPCIILDINNNHQ